MVVGGVNRGHAWEALVEKRADFVGSAYTFRVVNKAFENFHNL
jgi:hypothetical protein